jgi:hypothetical protein
MRVLACLVLLPTALAAQAAPAAISATAAPARPPVPALAFRGFAPGTSFRDFAQVARSLADRDTMVCQTSRRTARLMECGVRIRDPQDSVRFYVAAHFVDQKVDLIAFTDSGVTGLVTRTQRDLTRRFGRADSVGRGMWQWRREGMVARLTWRGRGERRWISFTLTHPATMNQVRNLVPPPKAPTPPARQ